MDERSHELFAAVLLEKMGISSTSPVWGTAPDIDMSFMHRWYRHRISVLPNIYKEFSKQLEFCKRNAEHDAIALCVVSHLYLDIFNGWVFPFGICKPVYPRKTTIYGVLEDIDKPKLLVKELRRLAGEGSYPEQFYSNSKNIMEQLVLQSFSIEELVAQLVRRLACYADMQSYSSLYDTAIKQIVDFTGNRKYVESPVYPELMNDACSRFEIEYAKLINKGMEA